MTLPLNDGGLKLPGKIASLHLSADKPCQRSPNNQDSDDSGNDNPVLNGCSPCNFSFKQGGTLAKACRGLFWNWMSKSLQ